MGVLINQVMAVLEANGVTVSKAPQGYWSLSRGDILQCFYLGQMMEVSDDMIEWLAELFEIEKDAFYGPQPRLS